MLKVVSSNQLASSMRLAQETGTEDQLIKWLLYLDEWHSKDETEVRICADIPTSPGSIMWYAHRINHDGSVEDKAFYNGGLIFFRDIKEWSIHS